MAHRVYILYCFSLHECIVIRSVAIGLPH